MLPFFVTIPHSGEKIPNEATWLKELDEVTLMYDVDRFVDKLYEPSLEALHIPFIKTEWHRYLVDLNRLPNDVDCDSVQGHANASGTFSRGLLWSITTSGKKLMPKPIPPSLHVQIVRQYFQPFHDKVKNQYAAFGKTGAQKVYHLDAHSMPGMGTSEHRDPGQKRASIVVSDCDGKSCSPEFKDLVIESYKKVGFDVAYNWPYKGGRITEAYGLPQEGRHAIQVEMNRSLYMNEETKQIVPEKADKIIELLKPALGYIKNGIQNFR